MKKIIMLVILAMTTFSCSLFDVDEWNETHRDYRGVWSVIRTDMEMYTVRTSMEIDINQNTKVEIQ